MTLVQLVVLLVVVGVGLYLVNSFVPMQARIKQVLNVVVCVAVGAVALLWLLGFLGMDTGLDLCARPRRLG